MNNWTVHVTDFGKIKEADIQVKPLTLFVGDNNSGKSYMMTLIYGLINLRIYFDDYRYNDSSEVYKNCCGILDKMLLEDKEYILSIEELHMFNSLLNEVLKKNKNKFISELFNHEVKLGGIFLEFPDDSVCRFNVKHVFTDEGILEHVVLNGIEDDDRSMGGYMVFAKDIDTKIKYSFFLAYIMECMIKKGFKRAKSIETIYFPTARTGFLLTYKTLVRSAMEDKFSMETSDKNLLTKPTSEFLTRLSSMTMQKESDAYKEIIEFIESRLINGHINISDLPTHDVMYTPKGGKKSMPMFVTSGVVTEMTPLLLFLKYVNIGTILMEEPEISLHPELQWMMARVLIRLTNAGVPVFATTHSDILLQHVNNMIKLSGAQDRENTMKKLMYTDEDLLGREDAAVYQFEAGEKNKTTIKRLICGDYGFEAMTFYDTLSKLNNQINLIEGVEE